MLDSLLKDPEHGKVGSNLPKMLAGVSTAPLVHKRSTPKFCSICAFRRLDGKLASEQEFKVFVAQLSISSC